MCSLGVGRGQAWLLKTWLGSLVLGGAPTFCWPEEQLGGGARGVPHPPHVQATGQHWHQGQLGPFPSTVISQGLRCSYEPSRGMSSWGMSSTPFPCPGCLGVQFTQVISLYKTVETGEVVQCHSAPGAHISGPGP